MRFPFLILALGCATEGKNSDHIDDGSPEYDTGSVTYYDGDHDSDGGGPDGGFDGDPMIQSLALDITEITMLTRPGEPRTQRFRLMATWNDGAVTRITDGVDWRLNDIQVGSIDGHGMFTTSTTRGGRVDVIAQYDGLSAIGEITVKYVDSLVPEGFDVTLFDLAETPSSGTGMLYPLDGVVVPKNQPSMHFQWEDHGATAYRLEFESDVTKLTVYSTSLDWISDSELWPVIGESNAGHTIESTLSARIGDQVVVKDPQSMTVQDLEAVGSIIYWTPTAQGLMEIPYGETARNFLTQSETGTCIGCHAVSSQGMVAFTYNGGSGALGVKTIDGLEDRISSSSGYNSNFKVFSPDGSMLLSGINGTLSLFDGITGSFISNPTIDGVSWLTHPDWSLDNKYLVFVTSPSMSGDYSFTNGTIMRAEHLGGGVFGPPVAIVSATDLDPALGFTNVYYPAVSPDSQWVMFNASTADSYDDPDASLFVVPIDGGTPIEMANANMAYDLSNSLPKWAPATAGDERWWFAFASRRNYGHSSAGNPQIWMSSFSPAVAETGADPSSTSIWMSNQNPSQNNHIPLWVP